MEFLAELIGRVQPSKPLVLDKLDLQSVAKYIKSDRCQNVFMMVGAGISTSAGIPDFRSPDTGLYANLARLNLPYPEAVFDIRYFKENPQPFYTLASELFPGSYRPTPTHSFIRLLAEKGKLCTAFTQNIDTLERVAGVPVNKVFEAHGSFANQRCIQCHKEYPHDEMKKHILLAEVPHCLDEKCGGLVKPDIVFFGEGLPSGFEKKVGELEEADLLLICGTSLTVYPFASLRQMVPISCPRVLINLDKVGDIGSRSDDVVIEMGCDEAVRKLCDEIGDGWRDDLERLWKETENSYTPRPSVSKVETRDERRSGKLQRNPGLEDEVARIAKIIEEKMTIQGNEDKGDHKEQIHSGNSESDEGEPGDVTLASIQPAASSSGEEIEDYEGGNVLSSPTEDSGIVHYAEGILSVPETSKMKKPDLTQQPAQTTQSGSKGVTNTA